MAAFTALEGLAASASLSENHLARPRDRDENCCSGYFAEHYNYRPSIENSIVD